MKFNLIENQMEDFYHYAEFCCYEKYFREFWYNVLINSINILFF